MSRDVILRLADDENDKTRYSYDRIKTNGYQSGMAEGARRAAGHLRARAVEWFKNRRDKDALLVRDLADEILGTLVSDLEKEAALNAERYPEEETAEEDD